MDNTIRIAELKNKLEELRKFKETLSPENVDDFEKLRSEIIELLNENQKIKFKQIECFDYDLTPEDYDGMDDLPF